MQAMPLTAPLRIVSKHSLIAISHEAKKQDEQAISDFTADLDAAVRDLKIASERQDEANQKIQAVQQSLKDRSWWGAMTANLNGKTDKDLAEMVNYLSTSLGLTQSALRVILKVQTEKNRLLRGFSKALLEKIALMQNDTHTLDGNQRTAALAFLQELQTQIDEQIRQQELVESHEAELQNYARWRLSQEHAHADLARHIDLLETSKLRIQQQLAVLEAEMLDIPALRQQIATLEGEKRRLSTPKAVFFRSLLPVCATILSMVALFMVISAGRGVHL